MEHSNKMIRLQHAHWVIWGLRKRKWSKYHARENRNSKQLACGRKMTRKRVVEGRGKFVPSHAEPICKQCLEVWLRSGEY